MVIRQLFVRSRSRALCFLLAALPLAAACSSAGTEQALLFRFTTDGFWLNLHHFLYVLGRVEAGMPDIERRAVARAPADQTRGLQTLSTEQRALWSDAVSTYAGGASRLDAVFDRELSAATRSFAAAGTSLDGVEIDASWASALERAAPIYRQAWWQQHQAANRAWVEALEPLLSAHGDRVVDFISRAYGETWPSDGYPVQVSGYSNWAGAYSTDGRLLVLSSLDDDLLGTFYGLEILFHEAAHQWDDSVEDALVAVAKAQNMRFSRGLSHAMLFFTVGEAVRKAVPDHVPYAEHYGLWQRRMGAFLPALEAAWRPFLKSPDLGNDDARDNALAELMRQLAESPEP